MKKYLLAAGILTSGFLGLNAAEASEVEKTTNEVNPLIEELRAEHPDWTITEVTPEEAAKVREELQNNQVARGPAPPLTRLYIDKVKSDVMTQKITTQQTSHAVSGTVSISVMEEGYGSENSWLDSERITYQNRDFKLSEAMIDFNNDRIVDAFYHTVTFNSDLKIPSGTSSLYRFNSTSLNSPWNTMEDSIYIPHL